MTSHLDWPQMWEKPSREVLLATLDGLQLSPPTWTSEGGRPSSDHLSLASQRKAETTRYLSSIIKSPLAWIEDDDDRERVWELASRRMAERCGRTAMGELVRRWSFDGGGEPFELTVREPALTGDSLGLKTWGSSYVLASHLPRLATSMSSSSLFKLFDESLGQPRPSVLELGSGTGLLGLAAAALWRVPVALSDLPDIVANLKHNVEANAALVAARGGSLTVGALTWGGGGEEDTDQGLFGVPFQFKVDATPPDSALFLKFRGKP